MIDISFDKNPELYKDYEACLKFLTTIKEEDFAYPEEVTLFHIYSELRNPKEAMALKSFLATQNLKKTKLIVWSDYDISGSRFVRDFEHLVELRVYDPVTEARDTILEYRPDILLAKDEKHYLQSDLFRILICTKYGGIFYDMDIVLLRDFRPILEQEFLYMWGSETDYAREGACATVMGLKKDSVFGNRMLKKITEIPYGPNQTCWGKDLFARMWQDGERPTIFPSTFFNTEWHIGIKNKEIVPRIQKGWFEEPMETRDWLFLDAFAWHWHNTSWKMKKPRPGSKFYELEMIIEEKLRERGIVG